MNAREALYYSRYCYFCQKVLSFLKKKNMDIELRSTGESQHKKSLISGGGKTQVPCLRIDTESGTKWMYESDDIIRYLDSAERLAPNS